MRTEQNSSRPRTTKRPRSDAQIATAAKKRAEANALKRRVRGRREWLRAALDAGIIAVILFIFIWPVRVSGLSMADTLSDNDRLFMSRVSVLFRRIQKGDIVMCRVDGDERNVIKRIIGTPGERVTIKDGAVFINGQPVVEPFAKQPTIGDVDVLLGKDEYFILGDNRAVSLDSRSYGPIKRKSIAARAFFRYWPLNKLGGI